jgi:transposase
MANLISKTVKGNLYWYVVESRRVNGKVKQEVIEYIGSTKKLYERMSGGVNTVFSENITIKSYNYGDTYALLKIADILEVGKILDDSFKPQMRDGIKRSTSLILAAVQRACDPKSKNEFKNWFETTALPHRMGINAGVMTSQHFWAQMDEIAPEELYKAEDALTERILSKYNIGLDKIALDYTNYFTYISSSNEKSTLARRGKNKQKRHDLRQCSLAVVTTKELGLPLFSHVYEGNKNDITGFKEYINLLKERMPHYNAPEITLVFDGGSVTRENLNSLEVHYICSFSLSYCKELYEIDVADYKEIELEEKKVKAYRTTKQIWDQNMECILTFSRSLYIGQTIELDTNISKTVQELNDINDKLKNPKSRIKKDEKSVTQRVESVLSKYKYISQIFRFTVTKDKVVYKTDTVVKEELMHKYFGKKLIVTDQKDWATKEIIQTYREQDCIEELFKDTKNTGHFSVRPMYHWTDQKIRVHIFICLLGLTLTAILQKELQNRGLNISKSKLMDELHEIRESWIKNISTHENQVIKKLEEMNDFQSMLWGSIEAM